MTDRAIVYCRVSSEEQDDPGTVSLEGQERQCREYADANDLEVVQVISEVHSGRNSNRPGLNRVRQMVKAGEASIIIVRDATRFMRNMDEAQILGGVLRRYGVNVHYVNRPPTGNVLSDRILGTLEDIFAEQENVERTIKLNRAKRDHARGGRVLTFDRPPYGYVARSKRSDRGRIEESWLEIDEDQADVVKQIFEEYAAGSSMAAIANGLSEDGVPSYADTHAKMSKSTHGRGTWGRTTIRKILANETYAGRWHYNKSVRIDEEWVNGELQPERREMRPREEWIEVEVPAIIEGGDTWQRVQSRLADNHKLRHEPRVPHPLQGRVLCANCGRRFQRLTRRGRKGNKVYVYWRCNGRGGKKGSPTRTCDAHSVNGRVLEAAVRDWVAGLALKPDELQQRYDERLAAAQPLTAELDRVDKRIEKEQRALERFAEQYAYGDIDKGVLDSKREKIQAEIARQRIRRTELVANIGDSEKEVDIKAMAYILTELRAYLAGADPDEEALAVPVEMVQDAYRELDLKVRVDAMDTDSKSAVLKSRLGAKNVLL